MTVGVQFWRDVLRTTWLDIDAYQHSSVVIASLNLSVISIKTVAKRGFATVNKIDHFLVVTIKLLGTKKNIQEEEPLFTFSMCFSPTVDAPCQPSLVFVRKG